MRLSSALLFIGALVFSVPMSHAQGGTFGIGGQLGDPTGLALKSEIGGRAFDAAAGWDLDDYLFVQGHLLLRERRFPGSTTDLRYFYGPGAFLAAGNDRNADDDLAVGFSFNAGISYYVDAFEFFGQLTPQLQLIEDTDFDLGGGIGVRYYP
jgi:hypothetical protein